jgi:tRNA-splicing endonuclease subunit Sen34
MAVIPDLPIPISFISGRYLLFSADAVTYLRREYHICGVFIGTLPQVPQQNVFLGLPLELLPEEARLLVEKGVACIVDEGTSHNVGMRSLIEEDKRRYLQGLQREGLQATRAQTERKEQQRETVLKKLAIKNAAKADSATKPKNVSEDVASAGGDDADLSLFGSDSRPSSALSMSRASSISTSGAPMGITPATSYPPLPSPVPKEYLIPCLPDVPPSYPLFAHLHSQGYFLSPGLRFGCQYMAYPGDPLRFHSHFLVVAADWDQELRLMEIVAGGRLGTGVKKGFLLGGAEVTDPKSSSEDQSQENVRTFSIEWAGM